MIPHYDSMADSPGVRRMRLSEDEQRQLRQALRIVNELRGHAEDAEAEELSHALCRAAEVLSLLLRHRGDVWLR
jgi:hypothetical protein